MADKMTFQFLDVGQGDGTLVQMQPDGRNWAELALIDFGERRSQFPAGWEDSLKYLVKYIAANTNKRRDGTIVPFVDILFLTHPDQDHYNKLPNLITSTYPGFENTPLHFGKVVYGGDKDRYMYSPGEKQPARNLIDDIFAGGLVVDQPDGPVNFPPKANSDGKPWRYANGKVEIWLLSVNYPTVAGPKNPLSLVLNFRCGDKSVMLQGDAEQSVEDHVRELFPASFLKSTAMKLGHHGSRAATSRDWIEALQPQYIFASGDEVWAHPYCEPICKVLNRGYAQGPLPIDGWYCCGEGSIATGEYWNNPTRKGVCMNLWYASRSEQKLSAGPDKAGQWHEVTGHPGWTWGVQWELELPASGAAALATTSRVVPLDPHDPKIGPAYDCSKVKRTFEESSVVPLLAGV